jgi:AcrR family transcriptional regulator
MPKRISISDIEEFRAQLCRAAERCFAERGIAGVTMRQLADAIGCSPMTPYRYFRDKSEILAAVRAAAFDRFAQALEDAGRRGGARVRARAVGEAYIRFAFAEPQAYRLMFDLSQPDEDRYPELQRAGARARRTMTAYIEALVAAGELAGDPALLGYVFWAAVHGLVVLRLAGKLPACPDFRVIHKELMRLLTRGAAPAAQAARSSPKGGKRHEPALPEIALPQRQLRTHPHGVRRA